MNIWTSQLLPTIHGQALRPEQRLCDHVVDGAQLTALVVASAAGDFVCQAVEWSG